MAVCLAKFRQTLHRNNANAQNKILRGAIRGDGQDPGQFGEYTGNLGLYMERILPWLGLHVGEQLCILIDAKGVQKGFRGFLCLSKSKNPENPLGGILFSIASIMHTNNNPVEPHAGWLVLPGIESEGHPKCLPPPVSQPLPRADMWTLVLGCIRVFIRHHGKFSQEPAASLRRNTGIMVGFRGFLCLSKPKNPQNPLVRNPQNIVYDASFTGCVL